MRLYETTLDTGDRRLIVHFDESKVVAEDDPRLGHEDFFRSAGDPDPDWCVEGVFAAYDPEAPPLTGRAEEWDPEDGDPPMRKMTRAEVEAQQEAEIVGLAREALAARRAGEDQEQAAAADPFADGGVAIKED